MLNIEDSKANIIVTLVTDIVLLFLMLSGLLRMRLRGGGMFGLGRLLWTQVRQQRSLLAVMLPIILM